MPVDEPAAQTETDLACIVLGIWYNIGQYGIAQSVAEAKRLLEKAVRGNCAIQHANSFWMNEARKALITGL